MTHRARPDGTWGEDGAGTCISCGGRLIEEVYGGGWMHSQEEPHAFVAFVYSDGTSQIGGGCLFCARSEDNPIHAQA